jgi:hypothetical protein
MIFTQGTTMMGPSPAKKLQCDDRIVSAASLLASMAVVLMKRMTLAMPT